MSSLLKTMYVFFPCITTVKLIDHKRANFMTNFQMYFAILACCAITFFCHSAHTKIPTVHDQSSLGKSDQNPSALLTSITYMDKNA